MVSIGDVTVDEGAGTASVPVSIDVPSSVDTVVEITTATGTAGTSDYTTTTTTVTIPAGSTSVNVSIPVTDDTTDEPNETFTVNGNVTSGNTSNTDPSGTVTITDNDGTPVVTIGDVTVDEGAGTASVPVSIDVPSSVDTVVEITTATGTAGTSDYTTTTTTVTIPAGSTSINVSIPVTDDTTDEPNETFTVNGNVTSGNTSNTDPSGTVTITDNDGTPVVSIGDVTVDEGAGTTSVPVSIDVPSSVDTVITIVTSDGSADSGDYTTTTTTVTIPAGSTSVNVSIPITDDTTAEPTETFTVNGTVTSGNTSNTDPSGTVTILDNDSSTTLPVVAIGDVIVDEDAGTATVPVSIDVPSSVDTVITIVTSDGSADSGDYTTTTTTVTIPVGSTSVNVSIPITDDTTDEPDETFTVNGTVTSGNTSNTDPSGTVTILDNDSSTTLPVVTIGDVIVDEDAGTATVPVSIDVPSSVDTVITIVTSDGSADSGDYTTTTTTVTIPAGSTSVNVSIPITDDTTAEPTETFTVNGTVTSGNTSNTDPSGTVTILDNDSSTTLPVVAIGDVIVDEDAGTATVPVSIDVPSSVDTVITIVTSDGSADSGDYTTTTTTVTIPVGSTSVNVSIPITDDTTDEPDETFTVNGTVTSGNTSNTDPSGTVTILDNDPDTRLPGSLDDSVTTDEDEEIEIDILGNDTDVPSSGTLTVTDPANGTVTIDNGGTPNDPSDDTVTYTPDPGFSGTDTFTYTVCDDQTPPNCSTATVTVDVLPTPDANPDTATTDEDESVEIDVLGNDTDVPSSGTLTVTDPANGTVTIDDGGTPDDPSDDTVIYTPDEDFNGTDTFTYTICDDAMPPNCETVTVVVDVNPTPDAEDDNSETTGDDPVIIDIFDNDNDVPDDGTLTIDNGPDNGDVTIDDGGTPNDPSDDTVTYTPDPGFTGTDTFTYTICDSATPPNCSTATVTIEVTDPCLTVYNEFSPNGDGINDYLRISCIDNFTNNTVEIFNRWGNTVYKVQGYSNDDPSKRFEGISNGRATIQTLDKLPVGTYYYVIDLGDGSPIRKGWIYINR
ncbi:Calx-beta domain-containing protein [Tenacibaculum jejuense]|uniref:Calx-beta domain-containing protein n=1 Tax=Tenacibaculum jejuense TaxID=584609 RepID=UPI00138FFDAD